ncbi:DUF6305 family protein [Virgibacillus doumboii]|uniref:DUF6305 family protein n=1 Tax=Virgibacillus doumboii TaxID=2697503 RepID=UPI0013DF3580|nr:DUF6305 family protein [Virgibacillus doumboii]
MIRKYIPALVCFTIVILFTSTSIGTSQSKHFNTYPNLPAPIGNEKILITSTGQAAEGSILLNIAESLNLEADYRPRALGTDLYDYRSVVITLGYSANGLSHTNRSFQEELKRTRQLVKEANRTKLPIILINVSGAFRDDSRTWELFELIASSADYYIGLKNMKNPARSIQTLREHSVPVTLVNQLEDLHTPFNSIFR